MSERPFRLAFRVEGKEWRAWLAPLYSMDGSILLGSIAFSLIENDPEIKAAFMAVMQKAVEHAVRDVLGTKVESWDAVKRAPFWERRQ